MNPSKNVGRKRLGRIAITGVAQKPTSSVTRTCQIVQRSNGVKKNISKSPESFPPNLSFSSSFGNDLDSDLDLMSALDKMETEYSKKSQRKEQNKNITASSSVVTRTAKLNASRVQPKGSNSKDIGLKSTPVRECSRARVPTTEKQLISDSFHDLSFASPMDISTPQIFKLKRSGSSSKRSSASRHARNDNVNKTEQGSKKSNFKTSTPQVTPCRNLRVNCGEKGRNQIKKKRVIDGLCDIQNEVNKENTDKTDFFQSLMVENVSLNESNIRKDEIRKKIPENLDRSVQIAEKKDGRKENKLGQNAGNMDTGDSDSSTAGEEKEKHTQVMEGNKNGDSCEINVEDLPQIPTRGDNKHETSSSVSAVGRTLEIQPDLEADQLALSSWGLPELVLKQYHSRGITHMFQWQAECLLMGNVLGGGNLVYSAPTSAGKTMVAELLVLKRVTETRKKAIIILPFVSVTREKMFYLQDLYQDAGIRVSGFMGHYAPAGGFSSIDVAVCTIEKGNSLINRMLEDSKLDQLGIIVIDELHLIGDRHRGYLLELLLTKISYMTKKSRLTASSESSVNIQVVGMSATLPNLDLLAQWLTADLYRTDYRPVPLSECVKIGTAIYDSGMNLVRDIDVKYAVKADEDHIVPLCIETIRDGHSILIFCPTKNWCEKLSETVARGLYSLLKNPAVAVAGQEIVKASDLLVLPLDQSALRDVVEQLRRTPVGVDSVLGRTIQFGVAYHHAGLTFDERDIVEGAFRQGILKVLVATSTLSSGVNLPARRVLIRTPVFHGQLIDFLTYKQMIGRAGRKGVDTAGESILLCKPNERPKAEQLVKGSLPAVQSTLIRNEGEALSSSLKRAILEVVVSGVAMTPAEVACYVSCTLLVASLTKEQNQTQDLIQQCVKFLQENEFVCAQKIMGLDGVETERFVPTQLGAAVLASSISPDEGLVVFSELQRARQCFVLENELHIIYQVTPIYAQIDSIDWYQYFSIWESLTVGMRKVAELVGIQESFLARAVQGRILTKTSAQMKLLAIHKRFYTALVLHDLVQETPVNEVARKYNCNKGQLQSLQQSAATFAGMVTVFCARLGWSNLELILSQFQNRLTFGVQRELCDLVRVSALNGQRARVMYNGGYQTVAALASAHPADVEALLKNSAPFQSNKKQDTESEWEAEERRKTRCIFLTGRKGVTEYEAAVAIITEAKSIVQEELGGLGIQWKDGKSEPGPALKSPVLLSPLAATNRSKKRRMRQLSNSKLSNDTRQCNDGDKGKEVAGTCVLSPPASKPESVVSKVKDTDVNGKNAAETEKVSNVPILKVLNANATGEGKRNVLDAEREQNITSREESHCKFADDKNEMESKSEKVNVKELKTVNESDKGLLSNLSDNTRNFVHRNLITTTAVIEKIPLHLINDMSDEKDTVVESVVNDVKKCHSESNENVTDKCSVKIQASKQTDIPVNMIPDGSSNLEILKSNDKTSENNNIKNSEQKNVTCTDKVREVDKAIKQQAEITGAGSSEEIQKSITVDKASVVKKSSSCLMEQCVDLATNKSTQVGCSTSVDREEISEKKNTINEENESKVRTIPKNQAKVVIEPMNDSEFGESFIVDTQCMQNLENQKVQKSFDENICEAEENCNDKETSEVKQIFAKQNACSEGIFSQDLIDSFNISPGNSLGSALSHFASNDLAYAGIERKTSTEKDVTDSNKGLKLNISDSGSGVDISQNALDMNISQFSSEDMFNQSADLVASSNYERIGLSDDSRIENLEVNDSYNDLHIPYQSGQEKCFEKADAPVPFVGNVATNLGKNNFRTDSPASGVSTSKTAFGQQLNVLGQFSSQRQVEVTGNFQENLHEDLALALEMGESFSSTFNVQTQNKVKASGKNGSEAGKIDDKLGDSFTLSMVEKAFETSNEMFASPVNPEKMVKEVNLPKHICNKNSKTEPKMKSNNISTHKSLLNVNSESKQLTFPSGDEFSTPRETVRRKRPRESPLVTNPKVQKMKAEGYSTPEALERHVGRTKKPTDKNKSNIDQSKSDDKNIRSRKRKSSGNKTPVLEKTRKGSSAEMNTSTGSDCVPPTPPDEVQMGSLLGSARTPCKSPFVTLSPASPFSPKIKRNARNASNMQSSFVAVTGNEGIKKKTDNKNEIANIDEIGKLDTVNVNRNDYAESASEENGKSSYAESTSEKNGKSNYAEFASEKNGKSKSDKKGNSVLEEHDGTDDTGQDDCEEYKGIDNEAGEDFLSPSFIDPDESGIQSTQSSFTIIDVCGDKRLFKTFIMEWRTKERYAVSLACEKMLPDCPGGGIGANFKPGDTPKKQNERDSGIPVESLGIKIVGIAVSWENRDAYYVSFTHEQPHGDPDDSLAPPPSDTDISIAIRMKAVKSVLQQAVGKEKPVTMVMFDVKAHYRALAEGCGFTPKGQCEDPKIACWMLDPGAREKNLHRMVTNLLPTEVHMLHGVGGGIGVSSLGMSPQNPGSGRYRATTEAVLVRCLGEYFRACLEKENIYGVFRDVEMSSAVTLCRMELNGFGFSQEESENQKTVMTAKLSALEEQAYMLAGHPFSLSATEDVAQVLYVELQLPPNGDPASVPAPRSLAPKRGGTSRRGRGKPQYSTSKDILEKLKKLHPLPGIILEWRRITNALTKTVFPLQKEKVCCDWLSMYRIYGDCQLHTATGRVSMTEPNLQNVPKDFEILLPDLIGESPPPNTSAPVSRRTRAGNSRLQQMIGQRQVAKVTEENSGSQFCVSMRHAFIPFKGGVLLAADYSQLELRMISYLSNDPKLIGILNKEGDVFKLITAQWKNIKPEDVTPEQRAQAKQVCYGMIYGIGAKALGEQLDVEENDAAVFIETFKAKYPGMRAYLRQTVEDCRVNGYVQTMLGRKRYLQTITSTNPHARAQAERQAVNTTVQGSAADLVKMAMIKIDERLAEIFTNTQYTHRHKLTSKHPSRVKVPPDGAYLVLQLHDELIYEVSETHVHTVAQLVKHCMERAMELPVKMPVKIKVGPSWGRLEDYEL